MNIPQPLALKPSTPTSRTEPRADSPTDKTDHTFEDVFGHSDALPEDETLRVAPEVVQAPMEQVSKNVENEDVDLVDISPASLADTGDRPDDLQNPAAMSVEPEQSQSEREVAMAETRSGDQQRGKERASLQPAENKSMVEQLLARHTLGGAEHARQPTRTPTAIERTDKMSGQLHAPDAAGKQTGTLSRFDISAGAQLDSDVPVGQDIAMKAADPKAFALVPPAHAATQADGDSPFTSAPDALRSPDHKTAEMPPGLHHASAKRPTHLGRFELTTVQDRPQSLGAMLGENEKSPVRDARLELTWPPAASPASSQHPTPAMSAVIMTALAQSSNMTKPVPSLNTAIMMEGDALSDLTGSGALAEPRSDTPRFAQAAAPAFAARADLPAGIARQIMDAMQRAPDRSVEIALNPAELGRVRLTLVPAELGMSVTIIAERPETLDLMRRNIDQLASAMDGLGYEDIAFTFDQGQSDAYSNQSGTNQDPSDQGLAPRPGAITLHHSLPEAADNAASSHPEPARHAGLDLRL